MEFEDFDGDEDVVDLRAFMPLGGVVQFNLLHKPPQPKAVGTWTITQSRSQISPPSSGPCIVFNMHQVSDSRLWLCNQN